jgi:queuine/archaeosine tRNA-ribosyltransferase
MEFEILGSNPETSARLGRMRLNVHSIGTPCFMPVGTRAS